VELFECLDAVARDAAGALDRARQPVLFNRLSWFRLLEQHCPPPGRPLVLRAQDEDGNRGWLFLARSGRRATAYANWYTLAFDMIFDGEAGARERLGSAIAGALRREGIAAVELHSLCDPDTLRLSFGEPRWWTFADRSGANWQADVAGLAFDDYWAGRPARLRNTAERKARGLACRVYKGFDVDAWTAYEAVYRASWKPEEGSPAFWRALAEQEGAAGTLRLGIARRDGEPVAAQFWLAEGGRATIHKLAYVERAKAQSPGTVLSAAMFRHAIDVDKVEVIDFGLGNDPYKADWMDRKEPVGRVRAFNRASLSGTLGAARALVGRLRND
jgi:hypothetical protein